MNLLKLFLVALFVFQPIVANASDRLDDDQIVLILHEKRMEIKMIGMLKYCRESDRESALLNDVIKSTFVELNSSNGSGSVEKSRQMIHAIDIQTVGIATGLSLAKMPKEPKDQLCLLAVTVADDMIAK